MKKILVILLSVMMILTSCNPNAEGKGAISVSVSSVTKGLGGMASEDCSYRVNVTSEVHSERFHSTIMKGQKATFNEVPVGVWTVSVDAVVKNSGKVIGSGSSTCTVVKGQTVPCAVNITTSLTPSEGNGTVQLRLSHVPEDLTVKFYTVSEKDGVVTETLAKEQALTIDSWYVEEDIVLPCGFYIVRLESFGSVILDETIFLQAGRNLYFSKTLNPVEKPTGGIDVSINHEGQGFPQITFSGLGESVAPGAEYTIKASVTGMSNPVWTWLINNVPVEGANTSTLTAVAPSDGSRLDITARAVSGTTVWSETKAMSVTDNMFNGKWIAESDPDVVQEIFVLDMNDGHMVYDRYGAYGRAMLGLESDYTVIKKGNIYTIEFNWFNNGRRYHFNVEAGTENAKLYCSPGDKEGGYVMTFKEFTTAPEFTKVIKECDSVNHCEVLIHPVYGKFIDDNAVKEPHTFVDGVCSECGFDSNKDVYKICSDFSWVGDEQIDDIEVIRYWPGIHTKCDGTVINDSNHFYYRKLREGRYQVYMPHTISDFYIENGGFYGDNAQHILSWYLDTHANGLTLRGKGPYNEVLTWLFTNEDQITNLDASTIDKSRSRTKVTTTLPSFKVSSDAFRVSCYTANDLCLEDGTPITSCDRFYVSYDNENSNSMVLLYYPLSLQEAYEKANGDNPGSGDPYHVYRDVYYPELDYRDYDSTVRTLMTQPFKVPDYKDYEGHMY